MTRPLVYIAGPYSKGDPVENVRTAIGVAERVEALGCDVFIPHLSMLWHLVSPAGLQRWYERDNVILRRCDAVFRFAGESAGADAEVDLAATLKLPVFFDLYDIPNFVANFR